MTKLLIAVAAGSVLLAVPGWCGDFPRNQALHVPMRDGGIPTITVERNRPYASRLRLPIKRLP